MALVQVAAAAASATGPLLNAKFMRPCRLFVVPSDKGVIAFVQVLGHGQDVHGRGGSALRHSQRDCGALVQAEERLQLQHLPLPVPFLCLCLGPGLSVATSSSSLPGTAGRSGRGLSRVLLVVW